MADHSTSSADSPKPDAKPSTPDAQVAGFQGAKWLFVSGSLVGTLLIGIVSIYQWLPPFRPVLLALAMGVVLSGAIAFFLCEEERGLAFIKGFALWALCALPTVLWALVPVRGMVVDTFKDRLTKPAQSAALGQDTEPIRLRACVALGTQNEGTMAREIMASLFDAPELSAECIQDVSARDPDGGARLAAAFLGQWHGALRGQNDEAICAATPQVLTMSALTLAQPALDLTECAATYPDDDVSKCCADALTTYYSQPSDYTYALGSPAGLPSTRHANLFRALVPYAFARLGAHRRPLPELESRLLKTPPGQTWVVALGCDGLLDAGGDEYVEALEAIASTQSCESQVRGGPSVNTWKQICLAWFDQPNPSGDLCPALDVEALRHATLTASARVHGAIRVLEATEAGEAILRADKHIQRFDNPNIAMGEAFMAGAKSMKLPHDVFSAADRRAFNESIRPSQAAIDHYRKFLADHEKDKAEGDDG